MVNVTAYTNHQNATQSLPSPHQRKETVKFSCHRVIKRFSFRPLQPLKNWLETLDVDNVKFARTLCQVIPAQCPFERDVTVFGKVLFHIPPLCKLNPFYEQLVMLRFKSLCYLADECGEDISAYC
jgi:hypothetical protein